MRTRHFRDLHVWQNAMDLARHIYRTTESFPKDEIFGLRSQIRRAAVSVPSNIAEGHGRLSDGSMRIFLGHARGSLYELQTQIQLSSDLDYIPAETASQLLEHCAQLSRMLNALIKALKP